MHVILRNIIFITIIAITPYTQAKIYSWVDDDGKTHFTDITDSNVTDPDKVNEVDVKVSSADLTLKVQERKTSQTTSEPKKDNNPTPALQNNGNNGNNSELQTPISNHQ